MSEITKALELMTEVRSKTKDVVQHVDNLVRKTKKGEFDTSKGISFLEVKYQLLLSYLINCTYLFHQKTCGKSIDGDLTVDRLTQIRTILEKMRPIDQKLKYQIDKLIKAAATGGRDESDPLRFKANPDNFADKLDEDDENGDEEESDKDEDIKSKKSKVYVPPKLTAVHYDLDDTVKDKEAKALERAKKRALSSSIIKELRDEYYEGPEEIKDTVDMQRFKANKRAKERTDYEEERMIRFSVSKKEKNAMRKQGMVSTLDSITQFDDISVLDAERSSDFTLERGKKRKASGKGKKGKRGFKKKRR